MTRQFRSDQQRIMDVAIGNYGVRDQEDNEAMARMMCRVVAALGAMGVNLDVEDDDAPTPVEPTPAGGQEGTSMERSMTGQQDSPPPTPPENFSSERGPYWPYVYSPSSPEKFFDLAGSLVWDPGCGLDRPVGYSVDDRVDVLLRDGTVWLDCRVIGLNWRECGGGSIIRYRRRAGADLSQSGYAAGQGVPVQKLEIQKTHEGFMKRELAPVHAPDPECLGELRVYGADPDNGPDGAFGPDVVGDAGYRLSEWILRAALADELLALPDDAEKLSWVGVCSAINSAILRSRGS